MTKAAKTKSSVQLSDVTEKLRVSLQAFFPSPELSASTLCAHLKTYMWHFGAGQAANAPSSRTPSQVTRQGSQTGDPQTHTYIYTHTHLRCSVAPLFHLSAHRNASRFEGCTHLGAAGAQTAPTPRASPAGAGNTAQRLRWASMSVDPQAALLKAQTSTRRCTEHGNAVLMQAGCRDA